MLNLFYYQTDAACKLSIQHHFSHVELSSFWSFPSTWHSISACSLTLQKYLSFLPDNIDALFLDVTCKRTITQMLLDVRWHCQMSESPCSNAVWIWVLFALLLYVPVNNLSVMPRLFPVFLGWTSTKQRIKWLTRGNNTVSSVSLKIVIFWPLV